LGTLLHPSTHVPTLASALQQHLPGSPDQTVFAAKLAAYRAGRRRRSALTGSGR